jgi:hypothetical protein
MAAPAEPALAVPPPDDELSPQAETIARVDARAVKAEWRIAGI